MDALHPINCKIILLDIEGTTTSISFVKDVLFEYVKENLEKFLVENFDSTEVQLMIGEFRIQAEKDNVEPIPSTGNGDVVAAVIKNILWQMSKDLKREPLKTLQGKIYVKGFDEGVLKSHVFDDVSSAMEKWKAEGFSVYIYSSGSVSAQKLVFGHTTFGDLTTLLSGYFDTKIGPKIESSSYVKIATEIAVQPHEILFFTDSIKEAEAARKAGMEVVVTERPGNEPLTEEHRANFPIIKTFNDVHVNLIQNP